MDVNCASNKVQKSYRQIFEDNVPTFEIEENVIKILDTPKNTTIISVPSGQNIETVGIHSHCYQKISVNFKPLTN